MHKQAGAGGKRSLIILVPRHLLPTSFVWLTGAFVLIVAALLTQIAGGLCEVLFGRAPRLTLIHARGYL